jgi:hypothetical protein
LIASAWRRTAAGAIAIRVLPLVISLNPASEIREGG